MKLSVIIPTYNAKEELSQLLLRLEEQTISFELIIIDSSSTDGTTELAYSCADKVIIIEQKDFDHGKTRTLAAKEASGDILLFLTQDALPVKKTTLETLIHTLEDPSIGAVYGRQLPKKESSLFGSHLRYFNYPETSYVRYYEDRIYYGIKTAFLSDSFAAYRKEALKTIGWFKDGLIVGEDMYAGANLLQHGYAIAYCTEAEVYHAHNYTPIQEFQRYFDIGVFHTREVWLLDTFGKTEGEGGRYVRSELNYLLKKHAYFLIPEFLIRNSMKFIGYKLGKQYQKLPKKLVKTLSMHTSWWDKYTL
jgi:rhamnosyltransferase